jgi:hypothetical protein
MSFGALRDRSFVLAFVKDRRQFLQHQQGCRLGQRPNLVFIQRIPRVAPSAPDLGPVQRKIVGAAVHDSDDSDHAVHLGRRTPLAESIATAISRSVLGWDTAPVESPHGTGHAAVAGASRPHTRAPA